MGHTKWNVRVREILAMGFMAVLLLFWVAPVSALASLLNYETIEKVAPWLGDIIDYSPTIKALVQNTLPSVALISLNGLLPFLLEGKACLQSYSKKNSPSLIFPSKLCRILKVLRLEVGLSTRY